MKKVVLAFEGTHFSNGAFDFARMLNTMEPVLITGVFLPQVVFSNLWSYADGASGPLFIPLVEEDDAELVGKNIERFEELCTSHGIDHRVHRDFYDFALPELKKETRYADLVILGSESFFMNIGTNTPNDYLKEALHASECPVIIVPEVFETPASVILAYDGSESSVFAIKQFAYLFPQYSKLSTVLVTMSKDEDESKHDRENIRELVTRHFANLEITTLDLDPRKYFATWVSERKNSILVSGSFGRSAISQLFKRSFVSEVIAAHKIPVFITHR